jgi:multidrug efflux pump subunit AcrA (membrane-fusion protein)
MWLSPMPVIAHVVQRGEVVAEVMGTGTLESHISASISPKISGLIKAVLVDQGDRVEAGQVLVQLDDGDLSRQVEVAESALSAAHAAVERRQADRARALAVLDQARFDFDRVANLVKLGTGSTTDSKMRARRCASPKPISARPKRLWSRLRSKSSPP